MYLLQCTRMEWSLWCWTIFITNRWK